MFCDLAITFDQDARRGDLTLGDDFDLLLDFTPIPAIIMSVGLDRRADPDDPLPEGRSQFLTPANFSVRRGSIGDALDRRGRLSGCKLWLLDRAKQTEITRLFCEVSLQEGLAWADEITGQPAQIEVEWLRDGVLGYRCMVEDTSISFTKRVDA